jgi:hypothetical protein
MTQPDDAPVRPPPSTGNPATALFTGRTATQAARRDGPPQGIPASRDMRCSAPCTSGAWLVCRSGRDAAAMARSAVAPEAARQPGTVTGDGGACHGSSSPNGRAGSRAVWQKYRSRRAAVTTEAFNHCRGKRVHAVGSLGRSGRAPACGRA